MFRRYTILPYKLVNLDFVNVKVVESKLVSNPKISLQHKILPFPIPTSSDPKVIEKYCDRVNSFHDQIYTTKGVQKSFELETPLFKLSRSSDDNFSLKGQKRVVSRSEMRERVDSKSSGETRGELY